METGVAKMTGEEIATLIDQQWRQLGQIQANLSALNLELQRRQKLAAEKEKTNGGSKGV